MKSRGHGRVTVPSASIAGAHTGTAWGVQRLLKRTPGGARVFLVDGVPARFDAATLQLTRVGFSTQESIVVLGCVDEETVYVRVGDWAIMRARFGTGEGCGLVYHEK